MTIVPLFGHAQLRQRLLEKARADALPASILLHGPRGVGKQRLALWLGQALVCTGTPAPCGSCQGCRYATRLVHPDLHWYFPRPRPKDADPSPEEVRADYAEAIAERVAGGGLYAPPSGTEALFVATVRALVHAAAMAPALARRKVFVVGDAERMVPQEGAEYAANAFLKLLEEPPADTTIVLTSSEPGSLLPTVRSRVVGFRVPPVEAAEVRAFAAHPIVAKALDEAGVAGDATVRARVAGGAPGVLLSEASRGEAFGRARRLLDAAVSTDRATSARLAFAQGATKARGGFSDTLEALTVVLHERARGAAERGDRRAALGGARAVAAVERAKEMASGNVNPQLVTAALLRTLRGELA